MNDKSILADEEFQDVVKFHGCYCLDIAMGYRVAGALMREMGEDMADMKAVFAQVGTPTCAVDAIQKVTGCTFGKRNLLLRDAGKSVFILQNTRTGRAVRAYCHYWDDFDHGELRTLRKEANAPGAGAAAKAALQTALDEYIAAILSAPETALFRIERVDVEAPPKSSKYASEPCSDCGEYTNVGLLAARDGRKLCPECS